jgi:hypothetical protein
MTDDDDLASVVIGSLEREVERLRTELAAVKAEPPRPVAIVVHRHRATSKGFHLHLFEDDGDAVKYSVGLIDERVLPHDVRKIDEVTWHPKSP